MAIEFARVRYVKRSDGGNACRSAAYNARADLRCERTGERFYFAHRDGALHHEILLPEGAAERFRDSGTLWNAAQAAEKRKDSQEARELLLALPSDPGLGLDDWRVLTREFAEAHFVAKGVAVQIDIHAPHEGERNFHAHLLITTRRIEGEAFSATKARDLDPQVRAGRNGRPMVAEGEAWGADWRDHQNRYFERQGLELRVDETGVVPRKHEGPVRQRTVPEEARARAEVAQAESAAAARDPEQVLAAITRRRATFTELDIERQLKPHIESAEERAALRQAILAQTRVVRLHDREFGEFSGRYTTDIVRQEEQQVLAAAVAIGIQREAVADRHRRAASSSRTLDPEQQAAFLKATGTDGLVLIEGLAGTGKSYSVGAIREAHERAGWRVIGLAPTNTVADDLRRGGFGHGSTVHLELYYQENGRHDRAAAWDRNTCVVVDEAAMLDTPTYARLMRHAADTRAKVVLVGDDRQLASIERGGMFSELKERHGSAVIGKVRRQEAEWQRAASEDFAGGRVAEGLRAYAEHGHVHWSGDLDESRVRLLSDWDQGSRERPQANRFVYASTNAEVGQLNQAIRAIRVRRGEVEEGVTVETSRGVTAIGAGDRIQFFGNDRRAGIINGGLGTVTALEGTQLSVETDTGRKIRFDATEFDQFGLGYAGTVYRGQGKTETEVYALYESAFAWNARTAYVGMTRHRAAVNLYVPQSLAKDELALGRQMSRRMRDEASLAYATEAEIVDLQAARAQRAHPSSAASPSEAARTAPAADPFPKAEVAALRQLDLTAYARDVHGFAVQGDPARPGYFVLTRVKAGLTDGRPGGGADVLEVRRNADGHWTFRDPANPRDRGDIFDLAKREGAATLAASRAQVALWAEQAGHLETGRPQGEGDAMQPPQNRRRPADGQPDSGLDPSSPDAALRQAGLDEQRRRDAAGAAHEAREAGIAADEAKRQAFVREEADRKARLDAESRQATEAEQVRLSEMQQRRPLHHEAYTAEQGARAEASRRLTGIQGPEAVARRQRLPAGDPDAHPASAQLRYAESLAAHYDTRDPYGSLARASLAESAAWQRDRFELDRKIALEGDPARRDMLILRRDIEHNDHMGQAWQRVAGQCRAIGSDTHQAEAVQRDAQAQDHQAKARAGRQDWERRSAENPSLYPPLNEQMRARVDAARQEQLRQASPSPAPKAGAEAPEAKQAQEAASTSRTAPDAKPAPETRQTPEPAQAPAANQQPKADQKPSALRTPAEESRAMQHLDLPAYAADRHGYEVRWQNDDKSRASLHKGSEEVRAARSADGAWTYASRSDATDRGDIVDFEARRGSQTRANARETIRPTLERHEQQQAQNPQAPSASARTQESSPKPEAQPQPKPSQDGASSGTQASSSSQPEPDPKRRRGR